MVPETCWASNKICNKNSSVASSWHFISTYYRNIFKFIFRHYFSRPFLLSFLSYLSFFVSSSRFYIFFPSLFTYYFSLLRFVLFVFLCFLLP
jgi:hypothetical protein